MTRRSRGILLSIAASAVLVAGTGAASASADTTTDLFGRTTAAVSLSGSANQYTVVTSTTLAANSGTWVLTSTAVAVNLAAAPDFVRCQIQVNGTTITHSTAAVGNPRRGGGLDAGSEVIPITETGFVVTGQNAVTVNVLCGHDNGWDQPYVDPGATLWAHNSPSLATS